MKAVKFTLSGKTAFFKKPDVNTYFYFTFGNIHRVALLGILGAILGYDGYRQMVSSKKREKVLTAGFPAFYERLSGLKISIIPNSPKGSFPKSMQQFNNSVGYASQEAGGNLIVKEQWILHPSWDVYILLDCEEAEKICDSLKNKKTVYTPYLGKNDHLADITDVDVFAAREIDFSSNTLDCFFIKNTVELKKFDPFDDEDEPAEPIFKYEEQLPFSLDPYTNQYEYQSFVYTNNLVSSVEVPVYEVGERNLLFF